MLEFSIPNISIEENGANGTFVIEPLERGYGTTLGNSLRRVMLSSLPGAAVAYIKIDGVLHEFSTIAGVKEDVSEVVLNIKGIVAKLHTDAPKTAIIDVVGPYTVMAGDIQTDDTLEIINPDLMLATVADGCRFRMELTFVTGRGYSSADKNKSLYTEGLLGVIAVDSIFTPVLGVSYKVENTRVGSQTDFDRLTVEVKTNGSITPTDAMSASSNIIIRHFECIAGLSKDGMDAKMVPGEEKRAALVLDTSVDELEFSVRSYNCLKRAGIDTVGDITAMTESDLKKIRNLGTKSFEEIKEKIGNLGLSLKDED